MTKRRLNWNHELWTIVKETDGGVLFIPDNKSVLNYFIDYANGWFEGVVLYENFAISYTAESWEDFWDELELNGLLGKYYVELID